MGNEVKPRFSRDELILLAILFSAVVIVGTGIQMGSALFPALSRLMGVPVETVTLLVSVWAFTGILSPLFGLPSDRYGHTVFVLIGLGAFILGNLLSAIVPTFSALLVFQVLVGLGYAVFNFSASAVVGDVFAYKTRARAMGIVRVAVSVAALVGVPAATAIADWATARGSFGTVGGLGLVVLAVALALLPKLSRQEAKTQATEVKADLLQTVMGIARQRSAMVGLLAVLAWAAIPTGLFIYLAAWLEQTFQLTQAQVGLTFSMAGVGALIGNALTAAWADQLGKKRSAVIGLLVLSVTAMALPRSSILAGVLIGLIVFFAALEFSFASFSTLMTELAPTGRGTLMSLVSLANGIGTGAAPLVTRPLWESRGYAVIALVLGVVGLGVTAIVGLFVTERQTSVS
jgi:DHA1 family inner membrane transport protein